MLNLTEANYHSPEANRHYMSFSTCMALMECPARWWAVQNKTYEPFEPDYFTVGQFAELIAYGASQKEIEIFKYRNEKFMRNKTNKEAYVLTKKYSNCFPMASNVRSQSVLIKMLRGKRQAVLTFEFMGVPFKVKIDNIYKPGKFFADFKTTAFPLNKKKYHEGRAMYLNFINYYDYPVQAFFYREAIRQNYGYLYKANIVAVSKSEPFETEWYQFKKQTLDDVEYYIKEFLPRLIPIWTGDIKPERCRVCNYCVETKIIKNPVLI